LLSKAFFTEHGGFAKKGKKSTRKNSGDPRSKVKRHAYSGGQNFFWGLKRNCPPFSVSKRDHIKLLETGTRKARGAYKKGLKVGGQRG